MRATTRTLLFLMAAALPEAAVSQDTSATDRARAAQRIDELVGSALEQFGEQPNEIVDDATFLRRAYLGIVGRIPNLEETERFLDSRASDKRQALVDELVSSPGYASHMFNQWADLLRAKDRLAQQTSGAPFLKFLDESFQQNKPYDEFVREMLTATGAAHARDNGATGYLMRDRGMLEDNMANTVRVFLGTRLECAMCHDHPTDKWTQKQFYEMAAFSGGVQFRMNLRSTPEGEKIRDMAANVRENFGPSGQQSFRRMLRTVTTGISGSGTGVVRLPDDYQYGDAKPNEPVVAKPLFGEEVDLDVRYREPRGARRNRANRRLRAREVDSRQAYAEWLTSPNNPRFTTVIANRMWKRVMGRGLIEPVDDMRDDTIASNPPLMRYLEQLMRDVGYDLRAFQHVLWSTRLAQRATPADEPAADSEYHFAGPLMRRMSAEQIWDSMLTFVVHDVDTTLGVAKNDRAEAVFDGYDRFFDLDEEKMRERIELAELRATDIDEFRRRVREARAREREDQRSTLRAARKQALPLIRQIQRARRQGDFAKEDELIARLDDMGLLHTLRRANRNFVRASEVTAPAPAGHFLREFGQSDREQIDGAHTTATVPQVLELVNGFVERNVLRKDDSPLMLGIRRAKSPEARIEAAFLAILNRAPKRSEVSMWRGEAGKGNDLDGVRDLVWTLVNSHEFRYQL